MHNDLAILFIIQKICLSDKFTITDDMTTEKSMDMYCESIRSYLQVKKHVNFTCPDASYELDLLHMVSATEFPDTNACLFHHIIWQQQHHSDIAWILETLTKQINNSTAC